MGTRTKIDGVRLSYQKIGDLFSMTFGEFDRIEGDEEVAPGVVLGFNENDEVVSIEIMGIHDYLQRAKDESVGP